MNISKEKIEELQTILKEDYGSDFSPSEMESIANNLLGAFDILAKINHENYYEQNRKQEN